MFGIFFWYLYSLLLLCVFIEIKYDIKYCWFWREFKNLFYNYVVWRLYYVLILYIYVVLGWVILDLNCKIINFDRVYSFK